MRRHAAACLAVSVFMMGCQDAPKTADVESALEEAYGDKVNVESVTRINGVDYPASGGAPHRYEVEYEAVLRPAGPVTFLLAGGLERSLYKGALLKGIYVGHVGDPQGMAALLDFGNVRWRTDASRPAVVVGNAAFTKTETGWRISELNAYLSDSTLALGDVAISQPAGDALAQADNSSLPSAPEVAGSPHSKCLTTPRGPYETGGATETRVPLGIGESFGQVRHIRGAGICVGQELVADSTSNYEWVELVGLPSRAGVRFLRILNENYTVVFAAAVHPDSGHLMSMDVVSKIGTRSPTDWWNVSGVPDVLYTSDPHWSPSGARAAFVGLEQVVVVPLRSDTPQRIDLPLQSIEQTMTTCEAAVHDEVVWPSEDRLRIVRVCETGGRGARIDIDLSSGGVSVRRSRAW